MLDRRAEVTSSPLSPASASSIDALPGSTGDALILIGRLLVGQLYVVSGWGKVMGLVTAGFSSGFAAGLQKQGLPAPEVMAVLGAVVELFGGLALVLGFKTRWTAVLMLIFTIAASFIGHRYWEAAEAMRRNQEIHFYKNVAIVGGFLWLVVTGGGRFSIDGMLRRRAP